MSTNNTATSTTPVSPYKIVTKKRLLLPVSLELSSCLIPNCSSAPYFGELMCGNHLAAVDSLKQNYFVEYVSDDACKGENEYEINDAVNIVRSKMCEMKDSGFDVRRHTLLLPFRHGKGCVIKGCLLKRSNDPFCSKHDAIKKVLKSDGAYINFDEKFDQSNVKNYEIAYDVFENRWEKMKSYKTADKGNYNLRSRNGVVKI